MACSAGVISVEGPRDTDPWHLFGKRVEMFAANTVFREHRETRNFYLPYFNHFPFIKPIAESLTPSVTACELPQKMCSIIFTSKRPSRHQRFPFVYDEGVGKWCL